MSEAAPFHLQKAWPSELPGMPSSFHSRLPLLQVLTLHCRCIPRIWNTVQNQKGVVLQSLYLLRLHCLGREVTKSMSLAGVDILGGAGIFGCFVREGLGLVNP